MPNAQAQLARVLQNGLTERARLTGDRHAAVRRPRGGERRVEADFRIAVLHAQAVRSDHPHVVVIDQPHQFVLHGLARSAQFAKTRGDDDESSHALAPARLDLSQHVGRWHGEHREVDVIGHSLNRRPSAHALHRVDRRVDRIDGAGKTARQQVVQQFPANGAAPP